MDISNIVAKLENITGVSDVKIISQNDKKYLYLLGYIHSDMISFVYAGSEWLISLSEFSEISLHCRDPYSVVEQAGKNIVSQIDVKHATISTNVG